MLMIRLDLSLNEMFDFFNVLNFPSESGASAYT